MTLQAAEPIPATMDPLPVEVTNEAALMTPDMDSALAGAQPDEEGNRQSLSGVQVSLSGVQVSAGVVWQRPQRLPPLAYLSLSLSLSLWVERWTSVFSTLQKMMRLSVGQQESQRPHNEHDA